MSEKFTYIGQNNPIHIENRSSSTKLIIQKFFYIPESQETLKCIVVRLDDHKQSLDITNNNILSDIISLIPKIEVNNNLHYFSFGTQEFIDISENLSNVSNEIILRFTNGTNNDLIDFKYPYSISIILLN